LSSTINRTHIKASQLITKTEKQKEAWSMLKDSSIKYLLLYGGSRSGKSHLICYYIVRQALIYAGSKHLIARYSFANAKKTIWLQTLIPIVKRFEKLGMCKIKNIEGIIEFVNGSIIMLGGLEPHRIDAILGGEYATVFVNEANENKWASIEILFSRLNDPSKNKKGESINPKFICDLNPTSRHSWDYYFFNQLIHPETQKPHNELNKIASLRMNPTDNTANLSADYLDTLQSMSESKKARFLYGDWTSYDGLVYQFKNEYIIEKDSIDVSKMHIFRAIDFGFVHPFTCLFIAYDRVNENYIVFKELTYYQQTVNTISKKIINESKGLNIQYTVSDHDAEDRATLHENRILTRPANKQVKLGIDTVMDLLDRGKIRVTRDCQNLINEFYAYRWKDGAKKDREVVKENDDHIDALRYGIMSHTKTTSYKYAQL
jgi:phage terminase large subunit